MLTELRWPLIFLLELDAPTVPELGCALAEDPDHNIRPLFFTERELAERWADKFLAGDRPVALTELGSAPVARHYLARCVKQGYEWAYINPAPGSSPRPARWHLPTVISLLAHPLEE